MTCSIHTYNYIHTCCIFKWAGIQPRQKAVIFSTQVSKKDTQDTPEMLRIALYHTQSLSKTTTIIDSCFHFDNQLRKLPSICIKTLIKKLSSPVPFLHHFHVAS